MGSVKAHLVKALSAKLNEEQEARFMAENDYNRIVDRCDEAERRTEAAEAEILVLKARLYDYMTSVEEEEK